jgi:hypothetical protein
MKTLMILVLLTSNICYSQTYSEDQMRRRTLEAVAKFYGIDTLGEEAFRRLQKMYLPKEYEEYIPFFGTMYSIVVDKRISYKMEF